MSDIRKYIDLIEAFGKKYTAEYPKPSPDPNDHSPLGFARRYDTAEQYADEMNPYGGVSHTDPPQVRDRAEREYQKLLAQWNQWKELGML